MANGVDGFHFFFDKARHLAHIVSVYFYNSLGLENIVTVWKGSGFRLIKFVDTAFGWGCILYIPSVWSEFRLVVGAVKISLWLCYVTYWNQFFRHLLASKKKKTNTSYFTYSTDLPFFQQFTSLLSLFIYWYSKLNTFK